MLRLWYMKYARNCWLEGEITWNIFYIYISVFVYDLYISVQLMWYFQQSPAIHIKTLPWDKFKIWTFILLLGRQKQDIAGFNRRYNIFTKHFVIWHSGNFWYLHQQKSSILLKCQQCTVVSCVHTKECGKWWRLKVVLFQAS